LAGDGDCAAFAIFEETFRRIRRERGTGRWQVLNGVTMGTMAEKTDGRIEAIRVDVPGAGLP